MIFRKTEDIEPVVFNEGEYRGVEMRRLITQDDGAPNFSMRVFALAPGGFTPFHSHQHEHEVYVLSGEGLMRDGKGERVVRAGDAILLAAFDAHQFLAGEAGLKFICCVPHH
jgi:quercetin dioxygenase-like cupin family protein